MSKKRVFYAKNFNVKYFSCGEKVCFADCEVCMEIMK